MDGNSTDEKCSCDKMEQTHESDSSNSESPVKEKKSKISLTAISYLRKGSRSLPFTMKRSKKSQSSNISNPNSSISSTKKTPKWMKFNCCAKKEQKTVTPPNQENQNCCKCTCYKRTEEHASGPGVVLESAEQPPLPEVVPEQTESESSVSSLTVSTEVAVVNETENRDNVEPAGENLETTEEDQGIYGQNNSIVISAPFLDVQWIRTVHEDSDEAARLQRAREIEQGVEAPANFRPLRRLQLFCSDMETEGGQAPRRLQLVCPPDLTVDSLRALFQHNVTLRSCPLDTITGCHTQVDFIHCLVPDLLDITNCSFYWGKMDRYEAERLLEGKPEGTFLLRDSAQEEFLFSVSFRKYGRSLHARIEQWNHKFSFDSHDPGVYTSDTVCGLIEQYKDPSSCMFFEPMLTWPLHRNFTFPLQHLCRAVIVSRLTYDNVNQLQLPKSLKSYLKEYHYRQKVRVERFDDDVQWIDLRNVPP